MHINEKELRQKIRDTISELYDGNHFNNYPNANLKFPYEKDDNTTSSPQEIDTDLEYVAFQSKASNNDTFKFLLDTFKKGLGIESKKSPNFSVYDHAEVVIKNLRDDKNFYSKFE